MHIKVDDLTGVKIHQLLQEHLQGMAALSPAESVHALNLDALRKPEITFWTVWTKDGAGAELLGCGAIKELDAHHAEVKSMRTAAAHLRKGVAKVLLSHILEEAKRRSYRRLSLETGSVAGFEAARQLYLAFGFTYCGPFGQYAEDPYSLLLTRSLESN